MLKWERRPLPLGWSRKSKFYSNRNPQLTLKGGETPMEKWKCTICGYIYDPEKGDPNNGIKPGTTFEKLPDDWTCPVCAVPKNMFEKISD
jgi:rubredoxin